MTTASPTSYYAWLTTLSKAERAPLLARMTQTELRAYAAYLFHVSGHDDWFEGWLNGFPNRELTADDVDD